VSGAGDWGNTPSVRAIGAFLNGRPRTWVVRIVQPTEPDRASQENARRRQWIDTRHEPDTQSRPRASRVLHRGRAATTRASAGAIAAVLLGGWLVLGLLYRYPRWWETVLYSVTSSITLLLVFALQHSQARQEAATQRKLDEILRSLPRADNRLIAVEDAADAELAALTDLNRDDRARAHDHPDGG
jgi:low affinity Fe/Cu permease